MKKELGSQICSTAALAGNELVRPCSPKGACRPMPPGFAADSSRETLGARFYYYLTIALVSIALLAPHCRLQGQDLNDLKVRHRAGSAHGFLVLRNEAGAILASGELTQIPYGDRIKLRIVFHFRDGSVHDETSIYSQRQTLRLISDHLVQRGNSFPTPCDITIDAPGQQVSIRAISKGKQVAKIEHMDLPDDLVNGIPFVLIENLPANGPEIEVPYLALSAKPRMVKLAIAQEGEEQFKVAGRSYKAIKYDVKVNLGGIAGVVAPMIGKQPADTQVWVSESAVPTIVRIDGALYPEGPVWNIELASPVW